MKPFSKLSVRGKRIAIAQDVLLQIKDKVIIPERGSYVEFPVNLIEDYGGESLKKLMNKGQVKNCKACALGGCFISLVKFQNKFNIDGYDTEIGGFAKVEDIERDDNNKNRKRLERIFGKFQLGLIECAFEMRTMHGYAGQDNSTLLNAKRFGSKYKTDTNRLKGIMLNLIKNEGEFKP